MKTNRIDTPRIPFDELKSTNTHVFLILFLCFSATVVTAQEQPPVESGSIAKRAIIVGRQQEGDGAPTLQIQSIQLSADGPQIFGPGVFSFSARIGDGNSGLAFSKSSNTMDLLQNELIRNEIDLVDEQYKKMKDFHKLRQSEIMEEVRNLTKPASSGKGKKTNSTVRLRGNKLKEMLEKQQTEEDKHLKEFLLPHQVKRLEQISHQLMMRNSGTLNSLVTGKLKKELDLSEEDIQNLKTKWKNIEEKLQEDIGKLRDKAKKALIGELTPGQRRKLDELLGEEFEDKPGKRPSESNKPQKPNPSGKDKFN